MLGLWNQIKFQIFSFNIRNFKITNCSFLTFTVKEKQIRYKTEVPFLSSKNQNTKNICIEKIFKTRVFFNISL